MTEDQLGPDQQGVVAMGDFKLNLDQAAIDRLAQQAVAEVQPQANKALQDRNREVRDEMTGQPVDDIYAALVERIGPNFIPNEENLLRVAKEIHAGTLTD